MDRPLEAQRMAPARRRTLEERRLRDGFKKQLKEARARRKAEAGLSRAGTAQRLAPAIATLKGRQVSERERRRSTLPAPPGAGARRRHGRLPTGTGGSAQLSPVRCVRQGLSRPCGAGPL
jgi:hypothetical protein